MTSNDDPLESQVASKREAMPRARPAYLAVGPRKECMDPNTQALSNALESCLDDSSFAQIGTAAVALNTLLDVQPGHAALIRESLASMHEDAPMQTTAGVHYLHCGLVHGHDQMLFMVVVDAPVHRHLASFIVRCQRRLEPLWRHLKGYPEQGMDNPVGVAQFLSAGAGHPQLVAASYPGVTAREVRRALDWMRKTMHFQIELAKSPRNEQ